MCLGTREGGGQGGHAHLENTQFSQKYAVILTPSPNKNPDYYYEPYPILSLHIHTCALARVCLFPGRPCIHLPTTLNFASPYQPQSQFFVCLQLTKLFFARQREVFPAANFCLVLNLPLESIVHYKDTDTNRYTCSYRNGKSKQNNSYSGVTNQNRIIGTSEQVRPNGMKVIYKKTDTLENGMLLGDIRAYQDRKTVFEFSNI